MIYGIKNIDILLSTTYSEWDANLYPRVRIYNSGGTELGASPKDLTYALNGTYYNSSWAPSTSGYYQAVYITYTDAGFTTSSQNYGIASETILIEDSSGGGTTSSVVNWISSNLEAYGGGGGKSHHYAVYGSKSIWTRDQRDKVIKAVQDTQERLKKFESSEKEHYKEAQDQLEKILKRVDSLIITLNELKINNKGMGKEIDNVTKALKKQRDIVSTSSQINAAIDEINNLAKIVVTMIPDEKLEDVYKELEVVNGSSGSSNRVEQEIS